LACPSTSIARRGTPFTRNCLRSLGGWSASVGSSSMSVASISTGSLSRWNMPRARAKGIGSEAASQAITLRSDEASGDLVVTRK